MIFILSYIYYALWRQHSSYRDEPDGVGIERFRAEPWAEPVSGGFKGDGPSVFSQSKPIRLRMAVAFCPLRSRPRVRLQSAIEA